MPIARLITWYTLACGLVRQRMTALRATGERGSHVVEYAIGIGLAAGVILALFVAYKAGLNKIISGWDFSGGGN